MKKVTVSAPAYLEFTTSSKKSRKPSLFVGINQRVFCTIESSKQLTVQISPTVNPNMVNKVIEYFKTQKNFTPITIKTTSLVNGKPVSCLAAFVGALSFFQTGLWNPHVINQTLYNLFKSDFHSGETTTAVFGGWIWYRKELSFLQSTWQLPIQLKKGLQKFAINKFLPIHSLTTESQLINLVEALKSGYESNIKTSLNTLNQKIIFYNTKPNDTIEPIVLGEEGIRIEEKYD